MNTWEGLAQDALTLWVCSINSRTRWGIWFARCRTDRSNFGTYRKAGVHSFNSETSLNHNFRADRRRPSKSQVQIYCRWLSGSPFQFFPFALGLRPSFFFCSAQLLTASLSLQGHSPRARVRAVVSSGLARAEREAVVEMEEDGERMHREGRSQNSSAVFFWEYVIGYHIFIEDRKRYTRDLTMMQTSS